MITFAFIIIAILLLVLLIMGFGNRNLSREVKDKEASYGVLFERYHKEQEAHQTIAQDMARVVALHDRQARSLTEERQKVTEKDRIIDQYLVYKQQNENLAKSNIELTNEMRVVKEDLAKTKLSEKYLQEKVDNCNCNALNSINIPEVNATLVQALATITERPVYVNPAKGREYNIKALRFEFEGEKVFMGIVPRHIQNGTMRYIDLDIVNLKSE